MQHRSFLEEPYCKVQLVIFLFLHFVPATLNRQEVVSCQNSLVRQLLKTSRDEDFTETLQKCKKDDKIHCLQESLELVLDIHTPVWSHLAALQKSA